MAGPTKTLPRPSPSDEFDLPDAEEYFTGLETKTPSKITQEFLNEIADEFDDDDFDDGPAQPQRGVPAADDFEGSAALSCLGLPEILERILVHVPPLQVYRLQRVNTMFRDLIARSIPIRRHIFCVSEKHFVRKELNDLLGMKHREKSRLAAAVHPFRIELYSHRSGPAVKVYPSIQQNERTAPDRLFPSSDKKASWRTILLRDLNDPVIVDFYVRDRQTARHGSTLVRLKLAKPTTLGDVVDYSRTLAQKVWRDGPPRQMTWREQRRFFGAPCLPWCEPDSEESDYYGEDI
ncbi:hypothetical protein PRZ48_013242 [Zasmidium cellare]|uniref:F-box domain-containing protein n=1 Tax=Zasmidium cellare TaxID=395010 RepID=A0ABR0E3S0_ZASCE|nr:hypothetical protein PRZ48_013242 [Zasmidium cellare]